MTELDNLRKEIDAIDEELVRLFDKRLAAAKKISKFKKDHKIAITQSGRQKEVLERIALLAADPLLKMSLPAIYKNIFELFVKGEYFFHHEEIPLKRIGIIGLGLMGGSLAKALKFKNPEIQIFACDPSNESKPAKEDSVVDELTTLEQVVEKSELIFICTPLSQIIATARQIASVAKKRETRLRVVDIGSVKRDIIKEYLELTTQDVEFLTTHPMAGKETTGYQSSDPFLWADCIWIIIPHAANTQETEHLVWQLIEFLGSRPLIMTDAEVHDENAAWISHIPALLSKSYYDFVVANHPESLKIAGPSFKSFTRLAHDNPTMWKEIHHLNRKRILSGLKEWLKDIDKGE